MCEVKNRVDSECGKKHRPKQKSAFEQSCYSSDKQNHFPKESKQE